MKKKKKNPARVKEGVRIHFERIIFTWPRLRYRSSPEPRLPPPDLIFRPKDVVV